MQELDLTPKPEHGERETIEAFIEIAKGSRNKYEFDHERNCFVLDRVLFSSVVYPCDYGFIEHTLAGDGDPLDVLVLSSEPTFPGCRVKVRPLGALDMRDEKGHDYKVLTVVHSDPRYEHVNALSDLAPHTLIEIENFFSTYKSLEGRMTNVEGWVDIKTTLKVIEESKNKYR